MVTRGEQRSELDILREENKRLATLNHEACAYIRIKSISLLAVIGTQSLNPDELDDQSLIEFDPIGIVAQTFQHILENLQETNQQLNFAHEEITTIFEAVGAGIMVLDPQGRVVAFNQKIRDLMLGEEIDIHGKFCRDHVCGKNADDDRCAFAWVMEQRREQRFPDWNFNGRSFDVIGRPMFNEARKITHVVLVYHEVSARRDAQNALLEALKETQDANAKINGILRSAADGILVTDASDQVVLINRRAEELLDLPQSELEAQIRVVRIRHAGLRKLLRQARQGGRGDLSAKT